MRGEIKEWSGGGGIVCVCGEGVGGGGGGGGVFSRMNGSEAAPGLQPSTGGFLPQSPAFCLFRAASPQSHARHTCAALFSLDTLNTRGFVALLDVFSSLMHLVLQAEETETNHPCFLAQCQVLLEFVQFIE